MNIALYCAVIYAYICSMVKDRVFALNHHKYWRDICARATARDYGADARHRTANGPLATRFRKGKEKKNPLRRPFKIIFYEIIYFTNTNVLRFNSTFTFLSNTNVNPVTLVRPT